MQDCDLDKGVVDVRFDLGVENSAVEAELVLVCCKDGRFLDEPTQKK